MDLQPITYKENTIFLLDKNSQKVVFSLNQLKSDYERLLNSLANVNFGIFQMEADGWSILSDKFRLNPLKLCCMIGENYTLMLNQKHMAVLKTPKKLEIFFDFLENSDLSKIIMEEGVHVCGEIKSQSEYKLTGSLNSEELGLLKKILLTNNSLVEMISDILSLTSGLNWNPVRGWMIVGKENSLVVNKNKFAIVDTPKISAKLN